ncbi:tautomerase family protein [Fulvivirga ligni]|uniref:tautomerase family protein n=1 Tax=Fulvivirga ligni TaxID=2904246 RepID=UPI001F168B86|nr:tautomerase family protein [Fulvivirga ligni]UII24043.1 4-oxalocrotonate tautomerase family protein [Fulvivirga ligni]
MPHLQIKLLEGKTEEQKKELSDALVKTAMEILHYGEESFSVSIEDFTLDQWKGDVYPKQILGNKNLLYKYPGNEM